MMNRFFFLFLGAVLSTFQARTALALDSTSDGGADGAADIAANTSVTSLRSTTSDPFESGRADYHLSSLFTFETSGSAVTDSPVATATAYMFQPTFTFDRWDLEASATICYNQYFTEDPSTAVVPEGNFDNHVLTLGKRWGPFAFGIAGALPANEAAREMTYEGSIGPSAKATVNWDRLTVSQTILYQRRYFERQESDDSVLFDTDAFKSLFEVGYQISDTLAVTGSSLTIFTVASDRSDYGIRSQITLDYQAPFEFTTSCGIALERGLSTLEGVSGKTDLAQAFVDFIIEI